MAIEPDMLRDELSEITQQVKTLEQQILPLAARLRRLKVQKEALQFLIGATK
jgi:prefoldin subunit 5